MTRLAPSLAAFAALFLSAAPALAADFSDVFGSDSDLRSGFSDDEWQGPDQTDPLQFELGVRYWYSWGAQNFAAGPLTLTENDNASSAEAHFRIDDNSTKFYAKGMAGMAFMINGSASGGPIGQPNTVTDGHIGYAVADLGYSWLGGSKDTPSFGPFAGYAYWNDSPNVGRATFNPSPTSGDSEENDVTINALRLGFSGKANLGQFVDVSGEVAAVPYAQISGTLGAIGVQPDVADPTHVIEQSSAADINGWGYGAMAEAFVGFHPTDNLTFRVGGRAWYLQGRSDSSFDTITVDTTTDPATQVGSQRYITTANPWSLFRYGALAEMTYSF
jgi:hypothetical protein